LEMTTNRVYQPVVGATDYDVEGQSPKYHDELQQALRSGRCVNGWALTGMIASIIYVYAIATLHDAIAAIQSNPSESMTQEDLAMLGQVDKMLVGLYICCAVMFVVYLVGLCSNRRGSHAGLRCYAITLLSFGLIGTGMSLASVTQLHGMVDYSNLVLAVIVDWLVLGTVLWNINKVAKFIRTNGNNHVYVHNVQWCCCCC